MDDQGAEFKRLKEQFYKNTEDPVAELAFAKALYGQQQLDLMISAHHHFRNVTIRQPENPEGFEGLGMIFEFLKNDDVAQKFFDKASTLRGNAVNGHDIMPQPIPANE